jgi:hypothetical protein
VACACLLTDEDHDAHGRARAANRKTDAAFSRAVTSLWQPWKQLKRAVRVLLPFVKNERPKRLC